MSTTAIGSPDTQKNSSNSSGNSLSPATLTSVVSTPRSGTEFKDRIFVGGFPPTTTDTELRNFFAKFGNVKEAKIIRDHNGASKGYGFITYETEEEAKKVRDSCGGFLNGNNGDELLDFKGRKLNVGPAIRKASNSRSQNIEVIPQGAVVLSANGTPFVVQNGLAFCATPDAYAVTQPTVGGSYLLPQQYVVAHPNYVIPSTMPVGTQTMQQMPGQSRVFLPSVAQQQSMMNQVSQQGSQMKADSPVKGMSSQINISNGGNASGNDSIGQLSASVASMNVGMVNGQQNAQYRWQTSNMPTPMPQYVYPPYQTYAPEMHSHFQPINGAPFYPTYEYAEVMSTSMESGEAGWNQLYGFSFPFLSAANFSNCEQPIPENSMMFDPYTGMSFSPFQETNGGNYQNGNFKKSPRNQAAREESPPPVPSPANARYVSSMRLSMSLPNSPANHMNISRRVKRSLASQYGFKNDSNKFGNRMPRSPSRKMDMYGGMQSHRVNTNSPRYSTPHRSYNNKYNMGRNSPAVGGYMRNNYGCPECEVQGVADGSNQTGVVTPPPTPITMDYKN